MAGQPRTSLEGRAVEAVDTIEAGLRGSRVGPFEEATTRHSQLASNPPSDQLGLVEAALATSLSTRGGPRDHVEVVTRAEPFAKDAIHDQAAEVAGDLAPVAILESEHHVSCAPHEREGSDDAVVLGRLGSGADERKPARAAQRRSGLGATCTR